MWFLDPDPGETPRDEFALVLLVSHDEKTVELLANRMGETIAFDERALIDEYRPDHSEIIFDDFPIYVRVFEILTTRKTEQLSPADPGVRQVPVGMQHKPLVPKPKLTESELEKVEERLKP